MKYFMILASLFLAVGLTAHDDTDYGFESQKGKRNGYQAYQYNFHIDRASGLTNLLLTNDFPAMNEFGNEFGMLLGFGRQGRKLTPVVKISYYDRRTKGASTNSNSASITGWGAGLGAEYKLLETNLFFIRPLAIVNFNTYTLNFIQNSGGNSIDGILNSDYNEYSFRSGQIPLQAGINIGANLNIGPGSFGIILGAGYILNWTNDNWKIGMDTLVEDKINLSSPYLSFGIITSMK